VLCLSILLSAGCKPPEIEQPPDEVTVQLKWVHQAQFAGFYVAEQQGFYAEENLDVTFLPGGVGIDMYQAVVDEEADFGVVDASSLIVECNEGLPLIAIATTYRINPFVLVAFADSGIRSPRDFIGHTVSLSDTAAQIQLQAMMDNLNLDPAQVNIVPYTGDTPFLDGEIDVVNSFVAGSLIPLEEEIGDREINIIWPGDYGVHFYSDTIITTDRIANEQPDLVERFLRATLEGHRFAIENPEMAVDASMLYADNQNRDFQEAMFKASIPLIHTGEDQIGWMRAEAWQGMHAALLEHGFLDRSVDLSTVYTMEFLELIYAEQP
jgi:NitT/TauT family transport system substrate-binding protein